MLEFLTLEGLCGCCHPRKFLCVFFLGCPASCSQYLAVVIETCTTGASGGVLEFLTLGGLLGYCHPRKFLGVFFLGCPASCVQYLAVVIETCATVASRGGVGIFGVGMPLWLLPSYELLWCFLPRMSGSSLGIKCSNFVPKALSGSGF